MRFKDLFNINEGSLRSNESALMVNIDGNWEYVFSRTEGKKLPITTKDRTKSIKGDDSSLNYFKKHFGSLEFKIENKK